MTDKTDRIWFGRNGPFYPYVSAYWAAAHGMMDLYSRRLIDLITATATPEQVRQMSEKVGRDVSRLHGASKTPQLARIELASLTGPKIELDISELEIETLNEFQYLNGFLSETPLRMLIICCYEATVDTYRDPNAPIWEFLRHCRHAAAHNGNFKLDGNEPRRPAQWHNLVIDRSLNGKPLLVARNSVEPFLKPGDVIRLLSEIEQTFNPRP